MKRAPAPTPREAHVGQVMAYPSELTTADIDAMKRASDRASRTLNAAATRAWLQSEVAAVVAAPGADA